MKEKCDNQCETCPINGQMYCALVYARATNQSLPGILEQLEELKQEIRELRNTTESSPVINPFKQ